MTLTKLSLVNSLHKELALSRTKSAGLIDTCLELIKNTLENGEDMLIRGFGKFCVRGTNNRRNRNPISGNDWILGVKRVVAFKASPTLVQKVNREP